MRSTFKVLFFLKRDKQKTNGNVPLYCRITVDGKEARFGMKCDVNPKLWDVETGKATGRTAEATRINALIENTKATIVKAYRDLQERDNYVTAERIKNIFLGIEYKQHTILELFDRHNKERKLMIGVDICKSQHDYYCLTRTRLADFIQRYYNLSDVPLKEVNKKFISDFEAYLCANYDFAPNTRIKQLKCLRHIISIAYDEELIMRNPFTETIQFQKVDRGYLTQAEVETLINFLPSRKKEEEARNVFIFCCFTGLPHIDVFNLTYAQIQQSFDGKMWIKGKRQKTKTEFQVPLLEIPQMIMSKYKNLLPDNKVLPVPQRQVYNILLKKIAQKCGITKNITSHLARHTFATLALTKGVALESVSKMLGHTSIKTTQIYARVTDEKVGKDMAMLAGKLTTMETLFNMKDNGMKEEEVSLKTFINIIDTFSINISEEQFGILKEIWQQLNWFEKITALYLYKDGQSEILKYLWTHTDSNTKLTVVSEIQRMEDSDKPLLRHKNLLEYITPCIA
ncbi:tyrosine recombinase [Bacteroidia bacterium]|nr:tyrosine recombinase [Bacteroidia bacterium]